MFLKDEKKYPSLREEFVANLNKRFDEDKKKQTTKQKIIDNNGMKNHSSYF
ncbi:MAG: hypothetical protein WC586_06975 [Methanoregula sp.]